MSPSSYESIVVVNDPKQPESQPYRIFMNNVLKHRGYRFYQSSYDPDEHGTILSVNHDLPGTVVTYIGYFLLSFGMLVSLFAPKSRFQFLTRRSKHLRTKPLLLILIALLTGNNLKAEESSYLKTIDYEHARKFGTLLVQDKQGRVKPVSALSGALLRKITRKAQFQGLHPDQVFLGMITAPQKWKRVPMIKISNDNLAKTLGIKGKYGAFTDFVDEQRGVYHLKKWVETAYEKKPAQRNTFDKEVMKVDERVNIFFLITRMEFTNFFPVPKHPHQKWLNYPATAENPLIYENNTARRLFSAYLSALHEATQTGHYQEADRLLERLKYHQSHYGAEIIPSVQKQQAEIWYNDANLFVRLGIVYGAAGFILFIVILIRIMSNRKINWLYLPITGILIITFLAHIAGLALRWYISDHAPWSDGYESMIYIGFATMAAGFIFMKNTPLALSAASILAAITLLVAHLSWMDPEITNLVPVLKSYWLTIHVSVITGSYGFLALGALMGLFNLILYTLKNEQNTRFIDQKIEQLSLVNEMTLTIGLYMLTIGTFLGGVWANESWGRYWGWDPKETWALISVIVYAFILHMRLIPGLGGRFLFNLASLVGFGSILMTYFGVNFYLSGLHSYAKGDPMPIPDFVYFTLAVITVITVAGFLNQRRLNTKSIPHDVDS
jgi:cytochrome c-type biogenesis protein CcsB